MGPCKGPGAETGLSGLRVGGTVGQCHRLAWPGGLGEDSRGWKGAVHAGEPRKPGAISPTLGHHFSNLHPLRQSCTHNSTPKAEAALREPPALPLRCKHTQGDRWAGGRGQWWGRSLPAALLIRHRRGAAHNRCAAPAHPLREAHSTRPVRQGEGFRPGWSGLEEGP